MDNLLIFGLQYPEPNSTAAGSRMLQLIDIFKGMGFEIHFACAQPETKFSVDIEALGIAQHNIQLNDSFTKLLLADIKPKIVLFDRFVTEEQFGWMVDEVCPTVLKILDTEDLHFLRENREKIVKKRISKKREFELSEKAKREIAAIYRCDLTLMISKIEIDILVEKFQIPDQLLVYIPFFLDTNSINQNVSPKYSNRNHFVSIGNFKHAPNLDMVKQLRDDIWPQISQQLPNAEWHIYGAYLPKHIKKWNNPKKGIIAKGRAEDAKDTLQNYKVMLAPLRYGAGIKGKLIDSMRAGTPSVTTSVGAEGITSKENWPGFVEDDYLKFVSSAVELYTNEDLWKVKHKMGFEVLNLNFDKKHYSDKFKDIIEGSLQNLEELRQNNTVGALLKHHLHRSTKFMSLWIEEKNKEKR